MNKILIVGGNRRQTSSIHKFLNALIRTDINEIHFKTSKKQSTKNPTNLGFIYHLSVIHFLSLRVSKSFTCFFFLFLRRHGKYTYMYRFIGRLCKISIFQRIIGSFLNLYHTIRTSLVRREIDADIIVFTGLMSTKIEMQMYWRAQKNNITTIYWPYNWDNCYGKHHSLVKFDHTFCWSKHMKKYCEADKMYGDTHILPHPRLSYIRDIRSKQLTKPSKILVALSQKTNKHLLNLMSQLREIQILTQKQVILRPHPDNHLNDHLVKLISKHGLSLDRAYTEFIAKNGSGVPAREENFLLTAQQTLNEAMNDTVCVISEGGTLCLEARAMRIPIAVLANNPWQVTARHFLQVDHFQPLCSKSGVHIILDVNEWAIDFTQWLSNLEGSLDDIDGLLDPIILSANKYKTAASNILKLIRQNLSQKF